MAPFVVPGVTLEEVLGAAKTAAGRRLYGLAAAAARDLATYVRERREDGDLEPVKLAGAPAADPPSAAGAPSHASPATVSRSTPVDEDLLNAAERAVHAYLDGNRGAWHSPRELAGALDLGAKALGGALRTWRLLGVVEHNGRLRTAARYRIPLVAPPPIADRAVDVAPSLLEDAPPPLDVAVRAELATPSGNAPSLPACTPGPRVDTRAEAEAKVRASDCGGYREPRPRPSSSGARPVEVSARVRRALEREQREKAQAAAGRRELADGGTLEGRLIVELGRRGPRGGTIPELATALRLTDGAELRDLTTVLTGLEDRSELERHGRRGPKQHVIYVIPDRLIDVA